MSSANKTNNELGLSLKVINTLHGALSQTMKIEIIKLFQANRAELCDWSIKISLNTVTRCTYPDDEASSKVTLDFKQQLLRNSL